MSTPPRYAVTVTYDESMIRKAVRSFIWQRFFIEEKLTGAALAVSFCFGLMLPSEGSSRWWIWLILGVTALWLLMALIAWRLHLFASIRRFRALDPKTAVWSFDEIGARVISSVGETRFDWSAFTKVWAFPTFWLLFLRENQFLTLPIQQLQTDLAQQLRLWLGDKVKRG